ncbi:MAG: BON domain-containing protein [Bdellovibrionota bacterium]
MGIRGDIDESDRDLNRDMYPNRTRSNRFNLSEESFEGSLGGHLRDFYNKSSIIRKDGYGSRLDEDDYADYTPKDINGTGKYSGKGPKNYVRSSERIEEDICQRLTADRNLDASFIDVNVIGDEVHLEGYVRSRDARWLAEDLIHNVPGVNKIINQLKIS